MSRKSRPFSSGKTDGNDEITPEALGEQLRLEEKATRRSLAILVAAVLLIFFFFLGIMFRYGIISLPGWLSGMFGGGESGGDERLYEALRSGGDAGGEFAVENIGAEELAELFAQTPEVASFNAAVSTVYFGGGNKSADVRRAVSRLADGSWVVELLDASDVVVRRAECDGSAVRITALGEGGEPVTKQYPCGADIGFTFESEAGLPDLAALKKTVGAIAEAGRNYDGSLGELLAVSVSRSEKDCTYYISLKHPAPEEGLVDDYYVSLEYGIVTRAQTRLDGELIWQADAEITE